MRSICWLFVTICVTHHVYALDVERTVAQVQNILKHNSQLPRLSRDEIIQLLNDIRSEDARSKSSSQSQEISKSTETPSDVNDINNLSDSEIKENEVLDSEDDANNDGNVTETTTKRGQPSIMVVLPYTPRDGSSLQELYTKPPRVELRPASTVTESATNKQAGVTSSRLRDTLVKNAEIAKKGAQGPELPPDLQKFLDMHGLKGYPGESSHFLLPLEGFKPLPVPKVIDGSIELPENILLTYDLIPDPKSSSEAEKSGLPPNNFLYEPLKPELPFELETSSSESKQTVLPLELPKTRKTKAVNSPVASLEEESFKVIPLAKLESSAQPLVDNDLRKRQTNDSAANITLLVEAGTDLPANETSKDDATTDVPDDSSAAADTDAGASITDLEDSFGGQLPSEPGDSMLPPPKKNGFYWMLDWNSFLEVGDEEKKVNIRFEPKLGDPQMFLPVNVP